MSYLATLSFDLENADSSAYEKLSIDLEILGLEQKLKGKKSTVELPSNTYCGEFNGDSTGQVRDYLIENIKGLLKQNKLKGKVFIVVGDSWSWGTSTI